MTVHLQAGDDPKNVAQLLQAEGLYSANTSLSQITKRVFSLIAAAKMKR